MIPGTFFEWDDQSAILGREIAEPRQKPLYAAVITSDKGKESWTKLSGQEWFDMYAVNNVVDFARHGQPLLQTAMSVNAGAEILCKRVVAEDACLANLAVIAHVGYETEQIRDSDGNPLFWDENEAQTTTDTGRPAMLINKTILTYSFKSAEGCRNKQEVIDTITEAVKVDNDSLTGEYDGEYFPLWIFFDNGRGLSRKRIRITPNYNLSKNYKNFFMYDLDVMESGTYFPTLHFCLSPDIISNNQNISLQYVVNTQSTQIEAYQFVDSIATFMDEMAAAASTAAGSLDPMGMDLLFGHTKKAAIISDIMVDTDNGVNLQIETGTLLMNGENGSFGDAPILEEELYGKLLAKAFAGYIPNETGDQFRILTAKDGCYDPIIYNVDRYRIDCIIDANYPDIVKRAIEQLVLYREDAFYFRDMGIENNTMDLIITADLSNLHTRFAATYCTYYDIINPYSQKQITVTMMYSMAQLIVQQFNNGRNLPMAGIMYGFVITDAIDDTIGFTPTVCPGLNQKEELVDARINYATYIDTSLVIETLYTSQDEYTQLSFLNNVLAAQEVVKEIRRRCPAIRYSFIDGDDLEKYRAKIEEIIAPFESNFKSLTIEYIEDPYYTRNKIFYAALGVVFRDFVQTEFFKITALADTADASAVSGSI